MRKWLAAAAAASLLAPSPLLAQDARAPLADVGAPIALPQLESPAAGPAAFSAAWAAPAAVSVQPPAAAASPQPVAACAATALPSARAQAAGLGRALAAPSAAPSAALGRVFDASAFGRDAAAPVAGRAGLRRAFLAAAVPAAAAARAVPVLVKAAPVAAHAARSPWASGLIPVLLMAVPPILALIFIARWQVHKMRELNGVEKPSARKPDARESADPADKVTFDDVAGQEEAKGELQRVVRFLKDPQRYTKINPRAKPFKGILFFGPPGTGKTLLARALANEAGAAFVTRKGSDFVNMYVGKGAANIREAFEEVRKNADGGPGILFIDEIDAVGHKRSEGDAARDNAEDDKAITALLAEMDGFEKDNIIVIAATNRPDKLDPALLRGGRFGLKVPVGLPDALGREAILKVHAKEMLLAPDVDLKAVAKQTPGLAGADLEHVVQRAGILAGDEGADAAYMRHFAAAIDEMTIGQQRKLVMSAEEKRVVAYHEAGHALVSHLLANADPVRKVTIIPHGLNALGLMQAMPEEEKNIQSRAWLLDRMAVAMGGRAGEELGTGQIYSGASNDFEQATRIARYMVTKFGMSQLGFAAYDLEQAKALELSEDYKRRVEAEVGRLLAEAQERARKVLCDNRAVHEAMAARLLEKETLDHDEMEALVPSAKRRERSGPEQLAFDWLAKGLTFLGLLPAKRR